MHQFGRTIRLAMAALIVGTSMSCAADRPSSVVEPTASASLSDPQQRSQLVKDIANVKAALATNDFYNDFEPGDAAGIQQRRQQIQGLLANLEDQLQNPQRQPSRFDDAEAPDCFVNGNLDQCFVSHSVNIAIDGSGSVNQVTSISGSQSAVVAYTLDSDPTPHQIAMGGSGFSGSGHSLSDPFTYGAPDCNVSAHSVAASAIHTVSLASSMAFRCPAQRVQRTVRLASSRG